MKQLVAVLVVAAMLVAGQSAAYAMAKKPNCDGTYGNASSPNYKYQFNQAKSGGAWNFDGTFNYRLDAEGNPIPNPVGVTTFTDGGRTMLCNGKPVTEYGVMCYDPNKVSYNEPEWLKCAGFKK